MCCGTWKMQFSRKDITSKDPNESAKLKKTSRWVILTGRIRHNPFKITAKALAERRSKWWETTKTYTSYFFEQQARPLKWMKFNVTEKLGHHQDTFVVINPLPCFSMSPRLHDGTQKYDMFGSESISSLNLHVSELVWRAGCLKAGVDESLEKQDRIEGMRHPSIKPHRTLIPCTTVREYIVVGSTLLPSGRDELLMSASILLWRPPL